MRQWQSSTAARELGTATRGRGSIIVLFSKKNLIFFSYNLFPPVLLLTLIVFKKTRKAKIQTQICLLATPSTSNTQILQIAKKEASSKRDPVPIIDSNKLLFEKDTKHELIPWIETDVDCENDVPTIELKDQWVEFGKWCTVKAQYFARRAWWHILKLNCSAIQDAAIRSLGSAPHHSERINLESLEHVKGLVMTMNHGVLTVSDAYSVGVNAFPTNSQPFERSDEWKEGNVLGFVCDMRCDSIQNNTTLDAVAEMFADYERKTPNFPPKFSA